MRFRSWIASPRTRLDVVAGAIDGILLALTLSAARLLQPAGVTAGLALRVGGAEGLTTIFVFFVAHYAEMRTELVHAERQLNLTGHGRLATTNLGRQIAREALARAVLAAICSLVGAALPLLLCVATPGHPWAGLGLTIALLGVL